MARQANGTYQQPAATAAVSGQTISSSAFNTLVTDIGSEITNSVDRAGRSAMTAALPMGGQKISGMAEPTISTDGATKNYVDALRDLLFSTGDVKLTLKLFADAGWIMADDGTIGNSTSGATTLANTTTAAALFSVLWAISNIWCPIFDSAGVVTTRGASAAADFAASKRLSVPKMLARVLGVAGTGVGLTVRALAQTAGGETSAIDQANLPSVNFDIPAGQGSHTHNIQGGALGGTTTTAMVNGGGTPCLSSQITIGVAANTLPAMIAQSGGSGTPLPIIPPTVFLNAMIKL